MSGTKPIIFPVLQMLMSVHYRKPELEYAEESVEIQRDHMNARVQRDISWPVMASHVLVSAQCF